MRVLLMINPQSRRGRRLGAAVRDELRRRGVEIVERADSSEPLDGIVAAGGDGTFARQIGRALELGLPLGLVPLGTFNDLAHTLAIPLDVEGACAAIAAGRTRSIDVARVNDAYYVNEASIGVSSRLARIQKPADKQRFGFLAIAASALWTLRYCRPFQAEIAYDGKREKFKAVQLTVANSDRFGGVITVDDAAIDDGWLDLYCVELDGVAKVVSVLVAMITRKRRARGLRAYRSTAFSVSTRRPHRITADGEPAGRTPARFELIPKALRVFVP